MDPEKCVSAHNFYVSIFQVERFVAREDPFVATFSDILVEFGRGQVGHSGDAQRGGRGDSIVDKCLRGGLGIRRDRGRLDRLQDRGRDVDIDCRR